MKNTLTYHVAAYLGDSIALVLKAVAAILGVLLLAFIVARFSEYYASMLLLLAVVVVVLLLPLGGLYVLFKRVQRISDE